MRVTFERDGGDFPIPALNRPIILDSSVLPAEDAEKLSRLLESVRFFEQPATVGIPPPGAVGYFTYRITAEDSGKSHTVRLNDFTTDPALLALRDFLASKA